MIGKPPISKGTQEVLRGTGLTKDQLFEVWLRLPDRAIRTLQKVVKAQTGVKLTVAFLHKIKDQEGWVEKAWAAEMLHEAETNREAYETIRDTQVKRRAESLNIMGEIYDEVLRGCRRMVKSGRFQRIVEHQGGPRELNQMIRNLLQLSELQERVMPAFGAAQNADIPEGEGALLVLDGPVNPLDLAKQLQALAERGKLVDLRRDAIDVEAE